MLDVIRQLLSLQDCDRHILQIRAELATLAPQRQALSARAADAQFQLEAARSKLMHLESDRKKLELDVEAQKLMIERFSLQQFQTKKNDEYRALTHQIDTCKAAIVKLEDRQLELMEQAEGTQHQVAAAHQLEHEAKSTLAAQIQDLAAKELNLSKKLDELEQQRAKLAGAVEPSHRLHYERLLKHKGAKVVVGIDHGVCGGCHMTIPAQVMLQCRSHHDLVECPNCGRILYYAPEMDLTVSADR